LLANAVYQPKPMAQTHRLRGQARSYTGYASDAKPVGAGLLANAPHQPKSMHRHTAIAGKRGPTVDIHRTGTRGHSTRVSPLNTRMPLQRLHR
jgi:hypothetical protein